MSLYSDDSKLRKATKEAAEVCKKEVHEVIKKHLENYLEKITTKWIEEELKKMGYLKKENNARSDNNS